MLLSIPPGPIALVLFLVCFINVTERAHHYAIISDYILLTKAVYSQVIKMPVHEIHIIRWILLDAFEFLFVMGNYGYQVIGHKHF